MSGHVRIHRTLIGHPAFRNDAEAMAFAWLVIRAAWRPTRVRYKERSITLRRGQLSVSQRDMARALDRDKAWIERLWKRLRAEAMIEVASEAGVAVITICKYDDYQASGAAREAVNEAQGEAGARQGQGTEQEREEEKKEGSVANATGAESADPVKELFDFGVKLLMEAGQTEKQARSLIGKWRKPPRTDGDVLTALLDCRARHISNPVEWLQKRFGGVRHVSATGFEYRGTDREIMRQAERRADTATYWEMRRRLDDSPPPKRKAEPPADSKVAQLVGQATSSIRVGARA